MSNKNKARLNIFIASMWILFTIFAFVYFSKQRLQPFDPSSKLAQFNQDTLVKEMAHAYKNLEFKNALLHFSDASCRCNAYSQRHIKELDKAAISKNFRTFNLDINKFNALPSSPSVAILNNAGELVYYGPYGEGMDCSSTKGFALTIFNNHLKGFSANLIVEQANGCYCPT